MCEASSRSHCSSEQLTDAIGRSSTRIASPSHRRCRSSWPNSRECMVSASSASTPVHHDSSPVGTAHRTGHTYTYIHTYSLSHASSLHLRPLTLIVVVIYHLPHHTLTSQHAIHHHREHQPHTHTHTRIHRVRESERVSVIDRMTGSTQSCSSCDVIAICTPAFSAAYLAHIARAQAAPWSR